MSVSYREVRRDDRLLDILTDDEAGVEVTVSRLGAELVSLRRRNGGSWSGFLYRDNDIAAPHSGWANHATVMGYFLHRLKHGRSRYRGSEIAGGTHSFLRAKTWRFAGYSSGTSRLAYEIQRDDFNATEYPLNVSLRLVYVLEGANLHVRFEFTNNEPELEAHVGFGLHPGFAASSYDSFEFNMPPGLYRRHLTDENLLSGKMDEVEFKGGPMPFPRADLPGSFILELVDVPERVFSFVDRSLGHRVELDFEEVPYVTLWSDGGPFLCVEPCWGLTDHHEQRAFEDKEGMQVIPPGAVLRKNFGLTAHLD